MSRAALHDAGGGRYQLRLHLDQTYPQQGLYFFCDSATVKTERVQKHRWLDDRLVEIELKQSEYAESVDAQLSGLLFFENGFIVFEFY